MKLKQALKWWEKIVPTVKVTLAQQYYKKESSKLSQGQIYTIWEMEEDLKL